MKRFFIFWGVTSLLGIALLSSAFAEPDGKLQIEKNSPQNLTLQKATAKALLENLTLSVFSLEKRVREARTLQSSLFPNPELEIKVDDAVGSGAFNGFGRSETTVQLGQLIELGGKRAARTNASRIAEKLADWDYDSKRLDVLTDVNKAFVEVLKAQHKVSLAEDRIELGNQFFNTVSERVKAGKVASIEKTKAGVALSTFKIEMEGSRLALEQARRKLSSTWGSTQPVFASAVGNLFEISPIPLLEPLQHRLAQTPYLERWKTEQERLEAVVNLERSKRIPDITLKGGYRRLEETNDNAVTFGISIPLQFFNRNQGAIAESQHRLAQIQKKRQAAELEITQNFLEAYQVLVFAHSQATTLQSEILPAAQKAFDGVNEGYRFGKFGYLDVLDSQKILFHTREQYLDALAGYHKALAEVNRLTNGLKFADNISESQTAGGHAK
ncbi:MAG: TolC family protein [Nitrospinae bacterium]|nr:TolC family protein [Nitrospinota bacterium]